MNKLPEPEIDLIPSLREVVNQAGLASDKLYLGFEEDQEGRTKIRDRHRLFVSDGTKTAIWEVKSLNELFRGSRVPPSDMDHYPEEYAPYFYFIENHLLTVADSQGPCTDQEMEEVYSNIRRRPAGRSLGTTHDFTWQICAFLLGCYVLSQAEFEALIGALLRSTRRWGVKPVSRNYFQYLRNTFRQELDED